MAVYDPIVDVPKTFVLCFDGTGNKFHADSSDSNVLKIFRVSYLPSGDKRLTQISCDCC